jgi:hypothetical protein
VSTDPRTLADRLAAVRHYECGDCWYSCPESDEGCCNDAEEGCTCWAPLCHEAAALLCDLAAERDALVAANQLWQRHVEGAIADTGNLPGDLTAWSAIRRLTAERDAAEADLEQYDRERPVAELAYLKGKVKRLTAERDAAVAAKLDLYVPNATPPANQLWQSNVEGAIADTGNLPGDLTAWSAIRRLTAERDELRAELDRILDAIGDPVGVDYCTLHDGIRNEDDHWCDFHDDDPEEGPDGEPRQCVLVPLVPMTYREAHDD